MHNIHLFVEDHGHIAFLDPLIHRLAKQFGILIKSKFESAQGGHGKMISKLKEYLERTEASLGHLLKSLRYTFQEWARVDQAPPQEPSENKSSNAKNP